MLFWLIERLFPSPSRVPLSFDLPTFPPFLPQTLMSLLVTHVGALFPDVELVACPSPQRRSSRCTSHPANPQEEGRGGESRSCVVLCACVAVCLCGCVLVWLCACVAVWLCACVAVWLLIRLTLHTDTPPCLLLSNPSVLLLPLPLHSLPLLHPTAPSLHHMAITAAADASAGARPKTRPLSTRCPPHTCSPAHSTAGTFSLVSAKTLSPSKLLVYLDTCLLCVVWWNVPSFIHATNFTQTNR